MSCCVVAVLIRELSVCVARARAGLLGGGVVVSVDEVNTSVDDVDVEVFRNMRPSVVITLDDAEHEEFMRIVESKPVADERLARLFKRPSPFGQHVELSE